MPSFDNTVSDAMESARSRGIWAVRNYHTTLEQRAIAGGTFTAGYWAMVLAATVMATAGLLLDSVAAVIGAMCVAPFMAPSRAVCIGALFRNWDGWPGQALMIVRSLSGFVTERHFEAHSDRISTEVRSSR